MINFHKDSNLVLASQKDNSKKKRDSNHIPAISVSGPALAIPTPVAIPVAVPAKHTPIIQHVRKKAPSPPHTGYRTNCPHSPDRSNPGTDPSPDFSDCCR